MRLKHVVLKGNRTVDLPAEDFKDVHILQSNLGSEKGKMPEYRVLVMYKNNRSPKKGKGGVGFRMD